MNKGRLIKQFDRDDFLQVTDKTVFLHTSTLNDSDQQKVRSLGGSVRAEGEGHLLAISDDSYHAINAYLKKSNIKILGCRSEWMSLEDLFIQTVKEQDQ